MAGIWRDNMAEEAKLQTKIIKFLKSKGCKVVKQNAGMYSTKGIPDIFAFYKSRWMAIEVKASATATFQPLQKENIEALGKWSYARVVFPENFDMMKEEISKLIEDEDAKEVQIGELR